MSLFKIKFSRIFIFSFKDFLLKNNKFNDDWNPLNILSSDAATVGNFDLDIN